MDACFRAGAAQFIATSVNQPTSTTVERSEFRECCVLCNQESSAGDDAVLLTWRERSQNARIDRVDHPALIFPGKHCSQFSKPREQGILLL